MPGTNTLIRFSLAGTALLLCVCAPAQALSLRCQGQIVSEHAREFEVLRKCGQPDFVEKRFEGLAYGYGVGVEVEEWYYEFGSNQLVRMLRFRNNRLTNVDTGNYNLDHQPHEQCSPEDIQFGLTTFELVSRCGPPVARTSRFEYRSQHVGDISTYPVTVQVEEWTYTFGGNRFIRHVTLVNGRVTNIETGEKPD